MFTRHGAAPPGASQRGPAIKRQWDRRTVDPREIERKQILKLYCDQDPLLRSIRKDLLRWFHRQGKGLGPTGASELLHSLGRLLAEQEE